MGRTVENDQPDLESSFAEQPDSLYEELIERAHDLFVVTGPDGTIMFVNGSFRRITGFERGEVVGQRLPTIFEEGWRKEAHSRLTTALQDQHEVGVNLPLRTKAGDVIDISFRPSVETDEDGTMRRMVLVGQSPFLYGELAEKFNSLNRDLKTHAMRLERLNADLELRIQERTASLTALLEVSASLNAEPQLDALFELILRQAIGSVSGANSAALLLLSAETDRLVVHAACGYENPHILLDLQEELERVPPKMIFSDRTLRVWTGESREKPGMLRHLLRNVDQFRIYSALAAPIATPSEQLGVLMLHNFEGIRAFNEDDLALTASLAGSAAIAIRNAQLDLEQRQQTERLEFVNRLSASVRDLVELDKTMHFAVEGLGHSLATSRVAVTLFDESTRRAVYAAQYSEPGIKSLEGRQSLLLGTPLMREVLGLRQSRMLTDARHDPRIAELRPALADLGIESIAIIPLVVRDRFVGAIELQQCDRPRHWRQKDIELVESVARQLATAIHQSRLHVKLRETVRESQALYRAASILIDTSDLNALLDQILTAIDDEFDCQRSSILLLDPRSSTLFVRTAHGHTPEVIGARLPLDARGIIAYVARTRRAANVPNVTGDARYLEGWEDCRSELAVPLVLDNDLIGVLDLQSERPAAFNERDLRILAPFAERAAFAIRQAQLNRDLQTSVLETTALYEATAAIASGSDLTTKLNTICRVVNEKLGWGVVVLSLVDESGWLSKPVSVVGLPDENKERILSSEPTAIGELERAGGRFRFSRSYFFDHRLDPNWFESLHTHVSDTGDPDPAREAQDAWHRDDALVVPIEHDGRVLGLLSVDLPVDGRRPTVRSVRRLELFADQAAVVINQTKLFDQVSHGKREWETTFDAMSDAVFMFDENRHLARANSAASALEGRSFADLTGTPCCEILGDVEQHECMVERAMKSGERLTFEWSRGPTSYSITVDPIPGHDGCPMGAVAVVRDLTLLREAERASQRHQEFLSHLVENAYDIIGLVNRQGDIMWHNRSFSDVTGYDSTQLEGRSLLDLVPARRRDEVRTSLDRAERGEPQVLETVIVDSGGNERDLVLTHAPVYEADEVTGVLIIGRDVTDEKQSAEKAAEADKLRALGQLASGVAHDFNNMLAAILGRAQLLKRAIDDEEILGGLEIIETAALDGAATVKRIQNFAQQRADSDFTVVDVSELVGDAIAITRTRWRNDAQSQGVHYDIDFEATPGITTMADASELREVFVNLIINALDAMPVGGRLEIATSLDNGWVRIVFADSGTGMSESVRRRIFEPFFTTKGDRGTGLGLAVSYGIVSRHNGRIEVDSEPDAGTVFSVWLPSAELVPSRILDPHGLASRQARILVIDDEESVRDVLTDMLREQEHEVTPVASGARGLEEVEADAFDIVFTDLSMPGMDGWAVARAVKQLRPATKVVLVTGYAASIDAAEDVDAIVGKPFDFNRIAEVVQSVLEATRPVAD